MNARKTLINLVTTYTVLQLNPFHAASALVFTPEQQAQIRVSLDIKDYCTLRQKLIIKPSRVF